MSSQPQPTTLYIGWDVGGWNCDKNNKSRDALVILDADLKLIGKPWRGNLRTTINEHDRQSGNQGDARPRQVCAEED
jgi:hypothetical protein